MYELCVSHYLYVLIQTKTKNFLNSLESIIFFLDNKKKQRGYVIQGESGQIQQFH